MPDEKPVTIAGIYTQPYNEIVRPGRVWKITKYFLRRWTPYLSASEVWLVIGARQLSYFNDRQPWFKAYDGTLAEAAALHVKVFRRTIKKDIVAGRNHVSTFLSKTSDPAYRRQDGVTKQTQTHYTIRLDDPLTPGDATALAFWLRRNCPPQVTPQSVSDLLVQASALEPRELRADYPAPVTPETPGLHAVADVVAHVYPAVAASKTWHEAADALHTHIVRPELAHFETQYLRRRWLPELGAGPALLLTYLRSLCYHNEESGEMRDQVIVQSGDLEAVFQVSSRTLRRWFSRLEEAVEDDLLGPWHQVVNTLKQPDQKVATTYWINLKTPLTPADLESYRQKLLANGHTLQEVADEKFLTLLQGSGQKVPHTPDPGGQKVLHKTPGKRQKVPHISEGGRQKVLHRQEGGGQKVAGSETKEGTYKYYKILARVTGLPTIQDLWQKVPEQQQQAWQLQEGLARRTFAVVVAEGTLEGLLDVLQIQEPARTTILRQRPTIEESMGWYLFAEQEKGLESPLSYAIKRLTEGDPPPMTFLQLASLSWEQWRTYAFAWNFRVLLGSDFDYFSSLPLFWEWGELYAQRLPEALPFAVGAGVDALGSVLQHTPAGSEPDEEISEVASPRAPAGKQELWQTVLAELRLQMTRATFETCLSDAVLVACRENEYTVALPSQAAKEWVENRLYANIARTMKAVAGREARLRFEVKEQEQLSPP